MCVENRVLVDYECVCPPGWEEKTPKTLECQEALLVCDEYCADHMCELDDEFACTGCRASNHRAL
jgi:hypothetical protein